MRATAEAVAAALAYIATLRENRAADGWAEPIPAKQRKETVLINLLFDGQRLDSIPQHRPTPPLPSLFAPPLDDAFAGRRTDLDPMPQPVRRLRMAGLGGRGLVGRLH